MKKVTFDESQLVCSQKDKLQTLLKEYLDLQKEYVGTKKKLQAAKERKEIVLAEVRFLRRRRNVLVKISESNVEDDSIHVPNSDALEGGKHQAMTESLDQVCVRQTFTNCEEGKRRNLKEVRTAKKSSNLSVRDKGMGKRKTTPRPSKVTAKSNSVAFDQ